jgi:drug/metabolite transporter (DMT)-like permease
MSIAQHLLAVLCVAMIAAGQVLFKYGAEALRAAGTVVDRDVILIVGGALAIYGIATLFWIALLQHAPLGRLYPYMALSFVIVAVASRYLFGEAIAAGHLAGLGMIVLGLIVIAATA